MWPSRHPSRHIQGRGWRRRWRASKDEHFPVERWAFPSAGRLVSPSIGQAWLGWRGEFVFGGTSSCLEPSLEDPLSILAKFCNLVQPFSGFGKLSGQVYIQLWRLHATENIYIKALEIYKFIFCTLIKDSLQNTACIDLTSQHYSFYSPIRTDVEYACSFSRHNVTLYDSWLQ